MKTYFKRKIFICCLYSEAFKESYLNNKNRLYVNDRLNRYFSTESFEDFQQTFITISRENLGIKESLHAIIGVNTFLDLQSLKLHLSKIEINNKKE